MLQRRVPVVLAVVAVLAAGCGSDDGGDTAETAPDAATESSATPEETAEPLPAGTLPCAVVWEDGATLPRGYKGCADDAGAFVQADPLACESGQKIIRYDDRFFAVPGGAVHAADAPLSKDSEYRAAALRCRA